MDDPLPDELCKDIKPNAHKNSENIRLVTYDMLISQLYGSRKLPREEKQRMIWSEGRARVNHLRSYTVSCARDGCDAELGIPVPYNFNHTNRMTQLQELMEGAKCVPCSENRNVELGDVDADFESEADGPEDTWLDWLAGYKNSTSKLAVREIEMKGPHALAVLISHARNEKFGSPSTTNIPGRSTSLLSGAQRINGTNGMPTAHSTPHTTIPTSSRLERDLHSEPDADCVGSARDSPDEAHAAKSNSGCSTASPLTGVSATASPHEVRSPKHHYIVAEEEDSDDDDEEEDEGTAGLETDLVESERLDKNIAKKTAESKVSLDTVMDRMKEFDVMRDAEKTKLTQSELRQKEK